MQENAMKLSLMILSAFILAGAANAKDADICLSARDVDHTSVLSDNEILYVMKNGKIWRNTLRKTCPGLRFEHAFSETIIADGICSNRQMITVVNRGTPCFLGAFTPYTPPPKS
jgi:hypothetical protein